MKACFLIVVLSVLATAQDGACAVQSENDGNNSQGGWILDYVDGVFHGVVNSLNPPVEVAKQVVWAQIKFVYEMTNKTIFPYILSSILIAIVFLTNCFMWQCLGLSLKKVLKFDSLIFAAYACCGPEAVLDYFQSCLYWTGFFLYKIIVSEYRYWFAVAFFLLLWCKEIFYLLITLVITLPRVLVRLRAVLW